MKYDTLSRNTVKITLTEADMRKYSLSNDCISGHNAETKRTLTDFVNRLKEINPLFPGYEPERLFLEAFPRSEGGCILFISTLGREPMDKPMASPKNKRLMLITGYIDCLSGVSRAVYNLSGKTDAKLYYLNGEFYLIIPCPRGKSGVISAVINEYGELSDSRLEIAAAEEHGKLLSGENTLEKLMKL